MSVDASRRSFLAGVAGVIGAFGLRALGRVPAAEAANGDAVRLGRKNAATAPTLITNKADGDGLTVRAVAGYPASGLHGIGFDTGVIGRPTNESGTGVLGASGFGTGVRGSCSFGNGVVGASESGTGVCGEAGTGQGVLGNAYRGTGVQGSATLGSVFMPRLRTVLPWTSTDRLGSAQPVTVYLNKAQERDVVVAWFVIEAWE
jgi:hypothetical protein